MSNKKTDKKTVRINTNRPQPLGQTETTEQIIVIKQQEKKDK